MKKKWFELKAADEDTAELSIFGEIGAWGVTVSDFKKEFDAVKDRKALRLLLNSPGGSAFDGIALYNILSKVRGKLSVEVVGLAASAASVVALAGDVRSMGQGGYFMIHNPLAIMMGTSDELRKEADVLDKIREGLVSIYEEHSNLTREDIAEKMRAETWFSAKEAVDAGFFQEVIEKEAEAAFADVSKYHYLHVPEKLQACESNIVQLPKTEREFERFLRDAGFSRSEAVSITSCGFKLSQGDPGEPAASGTDADPDDSDLILLGRGLDLELSIQEVIHGQN